MSELSKFLRLHASEMRKVSRALNILALGSGMSTENKEIVLIACRALTSGSEGIDGHLDDAEKVYQKQLAKPKSDASGAGEKQEAVVKSNAPD